MLNYLRRKKKELFNRNKEVPATEQFYTPLRIALHSTLKIDSVDMITLKGALHPLFVQPKGDLVVNAIGTFVMDGNKVYQVYVEDEAIEEFILQFVEGKDYRTGELRVDEVTLYKQVVTIEPSTEASLERALADIGFQEIELDEVKYNRLWGDQFTEKYNFETFVENVVTPQGKEQYTDNYILYGREINSITGEPVMEYLLVGLEENETEAQIMMQVGLQLNTTDIEVQ